MRHLQVLTVLVIGVIALPSLAHPDTYVVAPDGSGDFPTIQDAIEATADGDIIELTDGTFRGNGNRYLDYGGRAIIVRSQSGIPENCVIDTEDGSSSHRAFIFQTGETPDAVLEGIKIENGKYLRGPGIYCHTASPTIINCVFENLESTGDDGGAVLCVGACAPAFTGCQFLSNHTAAHGGAICCEGGVNLSVTDCIFEENWAEIREGAVRLEDPAEASFQGCAFRYNDALRGSAGAIGATGGHVTIHDCHFANNLSIDGGGGGGIYLDGIENAQILRCDFEENVAINSVEGGGALVVWGGKR